MRAVPQQHPANAHIGGKSTRAWGKCWGREDQYWFLAPARGSKICCHVYAHTKKNHCIIYGSGNNLLLMHIMAEIIVSYKLLLYHCFSLQGHKQQFCRG